MRSVSVDGFELFGSFVVIAAQPKATLCFVVDKSPEVTLCGWRGCKRSFNKQTLLISFVLLPLPTGRPFSWLVVCCRLWSITLTDTSSPRRMKGKARTLLILFLYMFLRVRVWASPLHELPFPYKDTVSMPWFRQLHSVHCMSFHFPTKIVSMPFWQLHSVHCMTFHFPTKIQWKDLHHYVLCDVVCTMRTKKPWPRW